MGHECSREKPGGNLIHGPNKRRLSKGYPPGHRRSFGAILAVLGNLFIWNWNKPDVRYGTGGAYIHPKLAIATVGLKNWGGSDAENVTITASFADPFTDFSTDQIATPFEPSAGGSDKKSVTGTIKRLAPGEIVSIYFITEPS